MITETNVLDARGHVEKAFHRDGALHLWGWMYRLGHTLDRISVSFDGVLAGEGQLIRRADVADAYPGLAEAANAGFEAHVPCTFRPDEWHALGITGSSGGRPVASLELEYRLDYETALPTPPAHLTKRVTNITFAPLFKLDGLRTLRDMLRGLAPHADPESVGSWLDWGCGCGRVTAPLRLRLPRATIAGCDVDGEAIAWCRQGVRGVSFETIAYAPPTQYPARCADVIISYSIFTHLQAQHQLDWLRECRRLLRPGGFLLATIHGVDAARMVGRPELVPRLEASGISDEMQDTDLDGVLPEGVYRSVFQSEAYTRRVWGQELEIVDFIRHGSNGLQDLVVLRA